METPRETRFRRLQSLVLVLPELLLLTTSIRKHGNGSPLDITVYEAEDKVGGRIKSAHIHDEPWHLVEAGATAFSEDDWCLTCAMSEVGLKPAYKEAFHDRTGIWDGEEFLISYTPEESPLAGSRRNSLKWFRKYGRAPLRLLSILKSIRDGFRVFAMFYPFRSLQDEMDKQDL